MGQGNPGEFSASICICPTQGHSLRVTFSCSPGGFPPNGLRGSESSSPRPLSPSLRAAAPSRPLGAARGSDPSRPPRIPFPTPGASPNPVASGVLRLQSPGLQTTSPSSLRTPPASPPVPGPTGGPGRRSLCPSSRAPVRCPPRAAPAPGPSPQLEATSQVLPAPPRSRADTV